MKNFELIEEDGTVRKITDDPNGVNLPTETANTDIAIQSEMGQLMKMAIEKNMVDSLEKLIALKRAEEERQCKRDFDFHFAEMQKEFDPIKRTKQADKSKYAPIEAMTRQYGEIISKHGFSYRWTELPLDGGGKRIRIIISGWGHTDDSVFFDVPKIDPVKSGTGKDVQNAIQVAGVMSTYGKRYTFKSGFGITEEDEDTDGTFLTFDDGLEYAEYWEAFLTCKTIEELKVSWDAFMKQNSNSKDARTVLVKLKNKRAEEILKESNNV